MIKSKRLLVYVISLSIFLFLSYFVESVFYFDSVVLELVNFLQESFSRSTFLGVTFSPISIIFLSI